MNSKNISKDIESVAKNLQPKARGQTDLLVNSTNIQGRINNNSFHALLIKKKEEKERHSQLILCCQSYLDIKIRQKCQRERKLQASISDEYVCNKNITKQNAKIHQKINRS